MGNVAWKAWRRKVNDRCAFNVDVMQNGYEPILLSSPHDWRAFIENHDMEDEETKHFIIIDDMFGTTFLDKGRSMDWMAFSYLSYSRQVFNYLDTILINISL